MVIKSNIQHEMFLIQHITEEYIKNNNIISVKPKDFFLMILPLKRLNSTESWKLLVVYFSVLKVKLFFLFCIKEKANQSK